MHHAVIFSHPNRDSFTASVAHAYRDAVCALGHEAIVRDLYGMGFDPVLKREELPFCPEFKPAGDVAAERALLGSCQVFAFVYPFWLNSPPAMMKGYIERVFGFGFAYGGEGHSYNPLLSGRKFLSFTSSGAPTAWVRQTGALDAMQMLFDAQFSQLTGMDLLAHVHAGGVTPNASEFFIKARLADVAATVQKHFGGQQ